MSAQASVTLQQLAPGVAGALLTTVAGLFVAIPAVFGYNYLTSKSRELITETENFASLVSDIIEMQMRTSAAYAGAAYAPAAQRPPEPERRQFAPPPEPARRAPAFQNQAESAERAETIDFSLDDDPDSPTPPRDFDD